MTMSYDEVFAKVRSILEEALGVDEEDVTAEATLTGDLGAESIDFLDIVFRLEKSFGIKIEQSEMFPDDVLNNPEYVQDGQVTDQGMAELRKKLPHVDLEAFDKSRDVNEFSNIFTVDTVVKFVQTKLG